MNQSESMPPAAEAFAALWAGCFPRVRAYAFLYVAPISDAEDVVQEIALAAARDFGSYDPDLPFMNWVIGIARNRIREHYRRRGRQRHEVFDEAALGKIDSAFLAEVDRMDPRRDALEHCLGKLPRKARQLIEFRYLHSLAPADIAPRLGLSLQSVYARLSQIRSALRECAERHLRLTGDA
jgi:RNA polymerase sigma-70 factor (ECF subfamily)